MGYVQRLVQILKRSATITLSQMDKDDVRQRIRQPGPQTDGLVNCQCAPIMVECARVISLGLSSPAQCIETCGDVHPEA